MDIAFKNQFVERWNKYFPGADLPVIFYYTNDKSRAELAPPAENHSCIICELGKVRHGKSGAFDVDAIGCQGGKRYLGFKQSLRQNFEYFLSYGIPGKMEGERYKKTPELVSSQLRYIPAFEAPGTYIVFKRWDMIDEQEEAEVVIFFAPCDVLSGLFTLVNFDQDEPQAVIAPFGAGCSSIVYYPYKELKSQNPKAILGMFDVSARPCVPSDVLTFAVPASKFVSMVNNMDESFLITGSWEKVKGRIKK